MLRVSYAAPVLKQKLIQANMHSILEQLHTDTIHTQAHTSKFVSNGKLLTPSQHNHRPDLINSPNKAHDRNEDDSMRQKLEKVDLP